MSRRRRWPRAETWLAALLLWGVPAGPAHAQGGEPVRREVLAVTLDGAEVGEPVLVRRHGSTIWLRAADLRAIGIAASGDGEVALASVAGIEAGVDSATQTLVLTRTHRVQRLHMGEGTGGSGEDRATTANGWGMTLNYDVTATRAGSGTVAGGLIDGVVYGPRGYFFGDAVFSSARAAGQRRFARLDTGFTSGDPSAGRRLTLGDLISGATETSRPVRLGGVQLATDFGLRPDLITFPVPAIGGTAAVPSSVDLIADGARRSAGTVRAGQFAVTDLPVQTGVNTVTVAVRDALGRETRQTVSTYVARTLLRPGLSAFSVEAGWVRSGYATAQDRYRALVASGSLRAGLSERLTVETHAEIAGRVGVATGGVSFGLGSVGLLSASVGASVAAEPEQHGGVELAAGFERIGRPVSVAIHYLRHSRGWYDLAADGGAVTRRHALSMTLGLELGDAGTLGLTTIDQGTGTIARLSDGRRLIGPVLARTTLVTASYSMRVARRLDLVATAGGDARVRRAGYISVGALLVFGNRASGYAGILTRAGGTSATIEGGQTAVEPGDLGYHVAAARGGIDRIAGDLSYQAAHGFYAVQVERTNGLAAARVSARGAVIAGGDGLFLADRQTGSFATVDTDGVAGVPIYRDNRRIGVTDRRGKLIVTNLPAYQPTRITLDPLAIDTTVAIDVVERWIRPAARAGVPVRFALRRTSRAALVSLVDGGGRALAAGARAFVGGAALPPVGMDGVLYMEQVAAANVVVVHLRGGDRCVARFAGPRAGAALSRIGPVVCVAERIATR